MLKVIWQYLIPQQSLSSLAGWCANCRWPWFKNQIIKRFAQHYAVDMATAQEPELANYQSFNHFFTRALKADARPIVSGHHTIACPVDGFISQFGSINHYQLLQAKGVNYSVLSLLGGSPVRAAPFLNGEFMTLYLAPKNYHRVHMPITGTLREMVYIPGRLFSVNPVSVNHVPGLFARNERVLALFDTDIGPLAMVLVGAMIVGSIATVWAGNVRPRQRHQIQSWRYDSEKIVLTKGEEMGRFLLGSTVIMLFPAGKVQWSLDIVTEQATVMGQLIGEVN